jgi:hypothetical protein
MSEINQFNFPEVQVSASILVNDTYSYVGNTSFYAITNKTYYDYYYRVIRRCSWWLDGYVPTFHDVRNGIFSTRLATSLVKGVGNQIVGKKVIFKEAKASDGKAIDFISKQWQNAADFQGAVRNGVKYAIGLGTSAIKLNKSGKDLWAEAVRLDYFYFESDFRGNLVEITFLIKHYANANAQNKQKSEDNFYLVEKRYFKTEKRNRTEKINGEFKVFEETVKVPKVVYQIHKYTGKTLNNYTYDPTLVETIRWDSIPKNVRDSIKRDYSVIEIGEEQNLPFYNHLGVELLRFDNNDVTLPQIPFGTPIIQDILSYLMAYDLAWSYSVRDMYLAKGMVIAPKPMTPDNLLGNTNVFQGLDRTIYEFIPSVDPEKQQPMSVQFNLRTAEWVQTQDNILKKIATTMGMSPKTIAGYLDDAQGQKTATEIDAEDDATISFIEIKRGIFERALNKLLQVVTDFYGFVDNIEVRFATPSLVNQDKIIDRAIRLLDSGLADEEEALKLIYPDDDERQIQERVAKMKVKQNELEKQRAMNPYGIG